MAKAQSFKNEPWTALERGAYSIFEDDFVHQKLAVFKITKKSETSTIALKETFNQKEGKTTTSDELKFWFPFRENRTLYARIKNDGFKFHYDHGTFNHHGYIFNFYSSVQGDKVLGSPLVKAGVETRNGDFVTNWRVRFQKGASLYLSNKLNYVRGAWSFGAVNSFNLPDKKWSNAALQLSLSNNDSLYYLRTNSGKKYGSVEIKSLLQDITVNCVHKYGQNTRYGLEVKANAVQKSLSNASAVWEHKCSEVDNTAVKVRGDINRNIAVSIKNNLKGYGNYIFGFNIADFGRVNRFSYGLQLDLNL